MGDRYILTIVCPKCGLVDDDCYYAPTCGFTHWRCPKCRTRVNLHKYTGISKEDASNASTIESLCKDVVDGKTS